MVCQNQNNYDRYNLKWVQKGFIRPKPGKSYAWEVHKLFPLIIIVFWQQKAAISSFLKFSTFWLSIMLQFGNP